MSWGNVGKFFKDNADWLIPTAIGGYDAVQRGKEGARARNLEDEGLALAREQWADRAPFRNYALQGLQALGTPLQTGSLFRDMGNPYSATYADMHGQDLGAQLMPQNTPAAPAPAPSPVANGGPMTPDQVADAQRRQDFRNQTQNRVRPPGMPYEPLPGMPR
jgi:hypothetical protein